MTFVNAPELAVSTLTVVILFGVNLMVHLFLRFSLRGQPMPVVDPKRIPCLEFTAQSFYALTREMMVMGNIMLYVWACENRPLFPHSEKTSSVDFFWFICLIILLFSVGTVHHDPKSNAIANRDQTEEWKGWMQTVFLLYHYFHANEVYNTVRVMISCYVWMTGFGNLQFFYVKQDFGFVRFYQMLWRLNFLVVFLCLTMNNMYMLYYICPLHTFYFLMTFAVMRVYSKLNHTQYGLRIKLACAGFLIWLIWEFDIVFKLVFAWLSNSPHPGAAVGAYGIQYEWQFRSGLDHWSTFFGMLFALNFPQATMWLKVVEDLPRFQSLMIKAGVGSVLLVGMYIYITSIFFLPKLVFNSYHAYTFFIPLLSYLFFRNATPYLRQFHLGFLAVIGKYTLETYLMQHHIWLTSNAKTLLVILPGYPKMNLALVTGIYFLVAQRLFRVTMFTRAMLIPENSNMAIASTGYVSGILGMAALVAWILQVAQVGWIVVGVVVIGLSVVAISFLTKTFGEGANLSVHTFQSSVVVGVSGTLFCILTVVLLPYFHTGKRGATVNAGPIRNRLTLSKSECIGHIGDGFWESTCPTCHKWQWGDVEVVKACNFSSLKSSEEIDGYLKNRKIHFLGDRDVFSLAVQLHRITDPMLGNPLFDEIDGSDKTLQFESSSLNEATMSYSKVNDVEQMVKSVKALNIGTNNFLVLGAWMKETTSSVGSSWNAVANAIRALNIPCVLVEPSTVAELKRSSTVAMTAAQAERIRSSILTSSIGKLCTVLPMHNLTVDREDQNLNGVIYEDSVYEMGAEIIANYVKLVWEKSATSSTGAKKGSGGGLAQNPFLGAIVLGIALIILATSDNYAGISLLIKSILAPYSKSITWADSVHDVHRSIGLISSYAPVTDGDSMDRNTKDKHSECGDEDHEIELTSSN